MSINASNFPKNKLGEVYLTQVFKFWHESILFHSKEMTNDSGIAIFW